MALCGRQPRPGQGAPLQLGQVLRAALPAEAAGPRLPAHHWKTLHALLRCHTPEMGGHLYRCADCGAEHFQAHSCRNRHCPSCQRARADEWLEKQRAALLPVPYFHVVFTLPHSLNPLIRQNQRQLYRLLFDSASSTLLEFGQRKLQAQIGLTAVLHTWSQTLLDHYHLHCIVTGGGLSLAGRGWKATSAHYLFPVQALAKVFRARFRDGLKQLHAQDKLRFHGALAPLAGRAAFDSLLTCACARPWVVYGKKPFAGPQAVLAYLARYTHRVAIGNGRLLALDQAARTVLFSYIDYAEQSRRKTMELSLVEFLRRFCLHILPERFVRIRHYGLLGNRTRAGQIALARAQLGGGSEQAESSPGASTQSPAGPPPLLCPRCGSRNLILILIARSRRSQVAPPLTDSS
jgi:DNA-directed RNA polymerase subunit RPC12/RpoP